MFRFKEMSKKKKALVAGGTAAVVIATGGIAFAYWSSTGSGTGTATTGTSSPYLVTIASTTTGDLTPGGPTDTVSFTIKNNNSGVQHPTLATPSVVSTSNVGCTAADFTVGTAVVTYGDIAPGGTLPGTFTLQMKNTAVNQDACKGVTVNLKVDVA